jgi:hypothetical protein
MASIPVQQTPSAPSPKSVEDRFRDLSRAWEEAAGHLSSMTAASGHPAYQEIIRLGQAVVPFLLRDLEENHSHWFIALRQITGSNPVPPSAAGDIPEMVKAWLRWAKDNGYKW